MKRWISGKAELLYSTTNTCIKSHSNDGKEKEWNDQQLFYRFSTSIRTVAFRTDWSRCSRTSNALAITELQESSLLVTSDQSMVSMAERGREWRTLHIWYSMAKHARTVVVMW